MIRFTEPSPHNKTHQNFSPIGFTPSHDAVVVRLFDQSSTMGAASAQEMAEVARQCEKALYATGKRIRIIDIAFDSHARVLPRPRFAQADPAGLDLRLGGSTNIREALETACSELLVARPARSTANYAPLEVLLLVSDGKYHAAAKPDAIAQTLKTTGVQIMAVAAGPSPNLKRLQWLASSPAQLHVPHVEGFS